AQAPAAGERSGATGESQQPGPKKAQGQRGQGMDQQGAQGETGGPAQPGEPRKRMGQTGTQTPGGGATGQGSPERMGVPGGQPRPGAGMTGGAQAGAKGVAGISKQDRTKITSVIKETRVEPVPNASFALTVGTRIPREVELHPLPVE